MKKLFRNLQPILGIFFVILYYVVIILIIIFAIIGIIKS